MDRPNLSEGDISREPVALRNWTRAWGAFGKLLLPAPLSARTREMMVRPSQSRNPFDWDWEGAALRVSVLGASLAEAGGITMAVLGRPDLGGLAYVAGRASALTAEALAFRRQRRMSI